MSVTLAIGDPICLAPAVSTAGTYTWSAGSGPLVIYFYPRDHTPGCTNESAAFRDAYADFRAADVTILGVSRDSVTSHQRFKEKLALPFELISDSDEAWCAQFDVIKNKTMYGKSVRGIERSTFILTTQGHLAQAWRAVKVPGHIAEVLAFIRSL